MCSFDRAPRFNQKARHDRYQSPGWSLAPQEGTAVSLSLNRAVYSLRLGQHLEDPGEVPVRDGATGSAPVPFRSAPTLGERRGADRRWGAIGEQRCLSYERACV